jgi:hypothetical protein
LKKIILKPGYLEEGRDYLEEDTDCLEEDRDYFEDRRDPMERDHRPSEPRLHQHPELQSALHVSAVKVAFDLLNDQAQATVPNTWIRVDS